MDDPSCDALPLTPSGVLDSSNRDVWVFSIGAKLFKRFNRDNILLKIQLSTCAPDGWTAGDGDC